MKLKEIISKQYKEGERGPRFYLPVYMMYERLAIVYWIFPLAPFVMLWKIISGCGWLIWRDLLDWTRIIHQEIIDRKKLIKQ